MDNIYKVYDYGNVTINQNKILCEKSIDFS